MTYLSLITNPIFFLFLLKIDKDIAKLIQEGRCIYCGEKLDAAHFRRKEGFGIPKNCGDDCLIRFSFCCRKDGCRRRATAPSLRFLPGKSYLTVIISLMSIMTHGATKDRLRKLEEELKISPQTIMKWRKWWREDFFKSDYWKVQKGYHSLMIKGEDFLSSLLENFIGKDSFAGLTSFLGFLSVHKSGDYIKISKLIQDHLKRLKIRKHGVEQQIDDDDISSFLAE